MCGNEVQEERSRGTPANWRRVRAHMDMKTELAETNAGRERKGRGGEGVWVREMRVGTKLRSSLHTSTATGPECVFPKMNE